MQHVYCAARIYQHLVHIKTVNTMSEYKRIMMGHNDPACVYWGKGYETVYRLCLFLATPCMGSVYPGFDCGCFQKLLLLTFRLVLIVKRSPQYIVYGLSGLKWCGYAGYGFVCCKCRFFPAISFPDISSEVPHFNQYFHQEF